MPRELEAVWAEIWHAREEANSNVWTNAVLFIVASGGFGAVAGDFISPPFLTVVLSPMAVAAAVVALVAVWDLFRLAWGFRGEMVQAVASWRNSTVASIEGLKPGFTLNPPSGGQLRVDVGIFRLALTLTHAGFKGGQRLFGLIHLPHFRVGDTRAFGRFGQSFRFAVSGLQSVLDILRQRLQAFASKPLGRVDSGNAPAVGELPFCPVGSDRRALSPDAALARIEEIRRSLLHLTSSPSIAPSPTIAVRGDCSRGHSKGHRMGQEPAAARGPPAESADVPADARYRDLILREGRLGTIVGAARTNGSNQDGFAGAQE
jgi:hypothetical protein